MTQEQLDKLLDACKPVPMIALQCGTPKSPQANANDAWSALGREMGFDVETVETVAGKSVQFFTAVPTIAAPQEYTHQAAIESLEACGYENEAGPLRLNTAFTWLKEHPAPSDGKQTP